MTTHESKNFFLDGPAGRVEAILWTPSAGTPGLAAVVCHPHPLFGGTLHNKVVFHTMKALNSFGFPVLRFNFRGTGLSEGQHDHGKGEVDDVRSALDHNLCRCGSHNRIVRAVLRAASEMATP